MNDVQDQGKRNGLLNPVVRGPDPIDRSIEEMALRGLGRRTSWELTGRGLTLGETLMPGMVDD